MNSKNILSLFLCLLMIFTVGSSIAVSSSAKEYNVSSISTFVDNASSNSALSISTQKTASFWNGFVTTLGAITALLAFNNVLRFFGYIFS